jgi:hypothetical protein
MTRDRNIEIVLDGNIIGLRVDNWALKETQNKTGCKGLIELFHKIGIDDGNIDIEAFTVLFAESMNEYNFYKGVKDTIDARKASEVIDEMGGIIIALQRLSEGLQHYIPKNQPAPQMEGQELITQ